MSDVGSERTSQSVDEQLMTTSPISNSKIQTQRPEIKGPEELIHFGNTSQNNVGGRLQFYLGTK